MIFGLEISPIVLVAFIIIAIWIIIEIKRFKHKVFAIFLIFLVLFSYISFSTALAGEEVNLTSFEGIKKAGNLYYSWLVSVFNNVKSITTKAINMKWEPNETKINSEENNSFFNGE